MGVFLAADCAAAFVIGLLIQCHPLNITNLAGGAGPPGPVHEAWQERLCLGDLAPPPAVRGGAAVVGKGLRLRRGCAHRFQNRLSGHLPLTIIKPKYLTSLLPPPDLRPRRARGQGADQADRDGVGLHVAGIGGSLVCPAACVAPAHSTPNHPITQPTNQITNQPNRQVIAEELESAAADDGAGPLRDHRPLLCNADDYLRMVAVPRQKGANFRSVSGVVTHPDGG